MLRRPPRSTRTDTLFPYTTLFRSVLLRARVSIRFAKLEIKSGAVATDTEIEAHVDTRFEHEAVADTERRQRSEEHTSELQSLMRISYAVFCLKKKNHNTRHT